MAWKTKWCKLQHRWHHEIWSRRIFEIFFKLWVLKPGAKALFQVHFPVVPWFLELWSLALQLFSFWTYISYQLRSSAAKIRLTSADFHILPLNLKNSTSQCRNRGAENQFQDELTLQNHHVDKVLKKKTNWNSPSQDLQSKHAIN